MGAAVRIEDDAFSDLRYYRLARALDLLEVARARGLDPTDLARGVMAPLWRQCTIENTYHLPADDVRRVLGERGVEVLIEANLGELRRDGRVRIRGTVGRIEWRDTLRNNGKYGRLGGRPKKTLKGLENETPPAPAPAPAPAQSDIAASPPPLTLTAEPDPSTSKRKRPATTLPSSWQPNGDHRRLAQEQRVDLEREAAKFRDWATAKDTRYASWDAAFSNWLRNARNYGAPAAAPAGPAADGDRFTRVEPRPARNGGTP